MYNLIFSPAIQALIDSGVYKIALDKAGSFLPYAIDNAGKIQALGRVIYESSAINPLIAPFEMPITMLMDGLGMIQTHRGFQKNYHMLEKNYHMLDRLQASVGVLQASTALIGLGTVAGVALSAVNLHQTLKIREDIKQLRLEVKDGFIDLKTVLKDKGDTILNRIDQVAHDVEFRHHRTILAQAYGKFLQALVCLKDSLKLSDSNLRTLGISNARQMLYDALADYSNTLLLKDTSTPGQLRTKECAWAIDQTITLTYQLQNAEEVVNNRLSELQSKITKDALNLINSCQSQDELDFLFPELMRINNHDLTMLKLWQSQVNWLSSYSPEERQFLMSSELIEANNIEEILEEFTISKQPQEQSFYELLKPKSHYSSLKDQLKFMIQPQLRQQYESEISEQAIKSNYQALAPRNWQEVSDLTVANFYWYFKQNVS